MDIKINDQKIDFTLEGGETALDIYNNIRSFLQETQHLIYSFSIDNSETDPEEIEFWGRIPTSEINEIDIVALTEKEYRLTGLLTLAEYLNFLINNIQNNTHELLSGFIEDYNSILHNVSIFISGEMGSLIKNQLDKTIKKSGLLEGKFNESGRKEFLEEIGAISELINIAAREIEDPFKELESTFKTLKLLNPRLSEVSVLLQTGKDREAMEIVINLTELMNKIFRLLAMVTTDTIETEKLNSVLSELAEAFQTGDSVLIGDLLEYEIIPLLEQLESTIEKISSGEV